MTLNDHTKKVLKDFEMSFGTRKEWLNMPASIMYAKRGQVDFYDKLVSFLTQALTDVAKKAREEKLEHLVYVFEEIESEASGERILEYIKKQLDELKKEGK